MLRTLLRATALAVLLTGTIAVATPASAAPVTVTSYDIQQTPASGFGGWANTYSGLIVPTGRITPDCFCSLVNYSGGSGTLNDGVIGDSVLDTHLFLTRQLADGPVAPVITLHLAGPTFVDEVRLDGGDVPFNIIPGALDALVVEVGGQSLPVSSTGLGSGEVFVLRGTPLAQIATDRVVLRNFTASFSGLPFDQFSISEATVDGRPAPVTVGIDVVPGDVRNEVTGSSVRVAVLSAAGFNAVTDVQQATLRFGRTGDEAAPTDCRSRGEDVNRDGRPDLICEFAVRGSGLTPADTTAVVHARTVAGTLISGTDRIRVR